MPAASESSVFQKGAWNPMPLNSSVVELVGAALSGSLVSEFFGWLRRRSADRKIARDEVRDAARDLIKTALTEAQGQMQRQADEIKELRDEIAAMRAAHAEEMAALKGQHADCEKRQAELEAEIQRLMAGQVAEYKPEDLRRPRVRRAK